MTARLHAIATHVCALYAIGGEHVLDVFKADLAHQNGPPSGSAYKHPLGFSA